MSIIVGTKAGDAFDLYARLLAQHMPKYIPGSPNIIVQNMTGAASLIAANHVYNVAKPDGLTIGAFFPSLYLDQVIGRQEVQFDWSKFVWIGSPVASNHLLYMRADAPYKSIGDLVKASEPAKCGASGTTATAYFVPKLLDEVIGTKFNIVTGYQSGSDVDLGIERGEVICSARTITAFFAREPSPSHDRGTARTSRYKNRIADNARFWVVAATWRSTASDVKNASPPCPAPPGGTCRESRCIVSPTERTHARYAGCSASAECDREADRAAWAAGAPKDRQDECSCAGPAYRTR